jgi:hypothetical protein
MNIEKNAKIWVGEKNGIPVVAFTMQPRASITAQLCQILGGIEIYRARPATPFECAQYWESESTADEYGRVPLGPLGPRAV